MDGEQQTPEQYILSFVKEYVKNCAVEDLSINERAVAIGQLTLTANMIGLAIEEHVIMLREESVPWHAIGSALGVSTQAAHKRFRFNSDKIK